MKIALIGDVHGYVEQYNELAGKYQWSLQLGDFGFAETYKRITTDPKFHKILGGNHDDYTRRRWDLPFFVYTNTYINQPANFLSDFGVWNTIFFVRGANSIDRDERTVGIDWWPFYRVFDTYTAAQEVEMYVGSKASPEKTIPAIADKVMASAKGFDKYSFRKDKSK